MMKDKEFGVNIKFDLFTTTSNFDSNEANNPCLFFVKDKNSSEYKRDNNLTNLLRSNEEFMKRVKDKLIRENIITDDLSNYVYKDNKDQKLYSLNIKDPLEAIKTLLDSYNDNNFIKGKDEEKKQCKNLLNEVIDNNGIKCFVQKIKQEKEEIIQKIIIEKDEKDIDIGIIYQIKNYIKYLNYKIKDKKSDNNNDNNDNNNDNNNKELSELSKISNLHNNLKKSNNKSENEQILEKISKIQFQILSSKIDKIEEEKKNLILIVKKKYKN